MIWELRCWRTRHAQKHARELKPLFCFLNDFTRFIHRWRGAYVLIATLARWTRWSIKVRHADHEITRSSLSTSFALSNKDSAKRWTCQIISFRERLLRCCALRCKCTLKCEDRESLQVWTSKGAVGLLDTQKFDTFYRVFKKAFENKRSSKPFGLLPFGASLGVSALTPPEWKQESRKKERKEGSD
jgi:hypothetical protein